MGLYKDGNIWCFRICLRGRNIRRKVGPSKREAEGIYHKLQAEVRENKYLDVVKKSNKGNWRNYYDFELKKLVKKQKM